MKYDERVEAKSVLDVDAKTLTTYYYAVEARTGAWIGDNSIVGFNAYTSADVLPVYVDNVNMVPVPEPITLALLRLGGVRLILGGLGRWRKEKSGRHSSPI